MVAPATSAPAPDGRKGDAQDRRASGRTLELGELLGGPDDGFARVRGPRPFAFPADHGPHPDFRTEWWYLTAHLEDDSGRTFGVQFTLFRQALAPPDVAPAGERGADAVDDANRPSDWRTDTVWMAHVGLLAPSVGHQSAERFARGALGLAGVQAAPFEAWLDDWTLAGPVPDVAARNPAGRLADRERQGAVDGAVDGVLLPLELRLRVPEADAPFTVQLTFDSERPPVLQGEAGFSQKGSRDGNASHYYSFTRLQARGEIRIDGRSHAVRGLGWLDREWSTSVLEDGLRGWDWFALHLDDGRDLMIYHLRRADGTVGAFSAGVLVAPDGSSQRLGPDDWALEPVETWRDERGAAWPVAWRLAVPMADVDGVVRAQQSDQLNRLAVRYWEGMVCLDGERPGCGYLEMTGYGVDPGANPGATHGANSGAAPGADPGGDRSTAGSH